MEMYTTPNSEVPDPEAENLPEEDAVANVSPVDLNTATKKELVALPRIGRTLAQRIIEARPFGALEELAAIPGLSAAALEELRPLVTLGDETEPESPEDAETERVRAAFDELDALEASLLDEDTGELGPPPEGWQAPEAPAAKEDEVTPMPEPAPEPAAEEPVAGETPVSPAAPAPPAPQGVSRGRAMGMVFFASLATMVLSIVFTLAVLAALNGGLRYASPLDVQRANREVRAAREQVQSVEQEIDGLRSRLDNMDALSGRVSSLEEQSSAVQQDVQNLDAHLQEFSARLDALDGSLQTLDTQMQTIQAEQGKYQAFFERLTQTLNELFGAPPESTPPAQESATPTAPAPTPTPTAPAP